MKTVNKTRIKPCVMVIPLESMFCHMDADRTNPDKTMCNKTRTKHVQSLIALGARNLKKNFILLLAAIK